jgi:phage recombination protein Bet
MVQTQQIERRETAGNVARRVAMNLDTIAEATGRTVVQVAAIATTVDKNVPLEELYLYIVQSDALKLDPLLRQCYWIKREQTRPGILQTGIDGYRLQASRSKEHRGTDDAIFSEWMDLDIGNKQSIKVPGKCSVTVWKRGDGSRKDAYTASVYWREYYPGPGNAGFMWRQRPLGQMAKCAEALAIRKAFPAELSGLWATIPLDEDEPSVQTTVEEQKVSAAARYVQIYGTDDETPQRRVDVQTGEVMEPNGHEDKPKQEPPVTMQSVLGQRYAELAEEAAKLEIEYEDLKVSFPADREEVIRKGAKLRDRIDDAHMAAAKDA